MGSERIEIQSKNLVSTYMFRFRRSDADIRNQWNNYTNYPDNTENNIDAMVGTYWYDPIKFMDYIKKNLKSV